MERETMNTSRGQRALAALLAVGVLAGCADTGSPAVEQRQKGVLQLADYHGPLPSMTMAAEREVNWSHGPQAGDVTPTEVIVAPERVQVGQPFKVTAYTVGGGCMVADGQDVEVTGNVVQLTPFDRQLGEICTMQLVIVPHESTITLDAPGEWVLRVSGRKVRFGDATWEQAISAEIRIQVE
jgi:hypothetical protein